MSRVGVEDLGPEPAAPEDLYHRRSKPAPFRMHSDGIGYDALRPTKGWIRVSAKRLRARAMLTMMNNRVLQRKLGALIQA